MEALPITAIAEIVLSVSDIPLMKQFYIDVLGFKFLKESSWDKKGNLVPDGEPTISFLTIKELDTPLGRHSHPQVLVFIDYQRHSSGRPGHDVTTSTLHHLAFEIPPDTYAPHHERLQLLNLDPKEVMFESYPAKSLFFKDPEGNSIELICTAVEES